MLKNLVIAVLVAMTVLEAFVLLSLVKLPAPVPTAQSIAYSDFVHKVDAGQVSQVSIQGSDLQGATTDNQRFQTHLPEDSTLVPRLVSENVRVTASPITEEASALTYILPWVPILLLTSVWGWYMSRMARAVSNVDTTLRTLFAKSPNLDEPSVPATDRLG